MVNPGFTNLIVRELIKEIISFAMRGPQSPTWYFIMTQMSTPVVGYFCLEMSK